MADPCDLPLPRGSGALHCRETGMGYGQRCRGEVSLALLPSPDGAHLECCVQPWAPQEKGDTELLEQCQLRL